MSYTLIDYFNAFVDLKRKKNFSAGVQATYFSILAEFNLQRFPAECYLSTRELKQLAGLKSVSTAQEARNILKNNKLIDFSTKNGTTAYILGTEHLPNTNRTPHAHSSTLPVCSKVETETLRQDLDTKKANAHAHANGTELDTFLDSWEAGNGCKLSQWLVAKLNVLMTRHGATAMTAALERANRKANNTQGGFSLEFFEKQLASQSPKSAPKGGEHVGKASVGSAYKNITFDDSQPLW